MRNDKPVTAEPTRTSSSRGTSRTPPRPSVMSGFMDRRPMPKHARACANIW